MRDVTNRTYAEIKVGASETARHTMTVNEIEGLALVAGEVDPFHVEGRSDAAGPTAPGAAAVALVSNLLLRRMPGPGAVIAETELRYAGNIAVGDELTATVTAKQKHAKEHRITFACRCVNQRGEVLVDGHAHVIAPTERVAYSNVATPSLILRRNDGFAKLIKRCQGLPPVRCAVVHPCDRDSLFGSLEAARRGLIVPVLVGPEAKIRAVAKAEKAELRGIEIVSTEHSHAAAEMAVEMARLGQVEALMKGSLHTDELMAAVVDRAAGLRTKRRISHCFVLQTPHYPRPFIVTDAAINLAPGLEQKADIIRNAIDLAHAIGVAEPKVAILAAVETVNPTMPATLDAAALCKMADRGQIAGGVLDGPLAFDNAVSIAAARTKGINSKVAGQADILVVPDLESGNMLAKQIMYMGEAASAGIVLGAKVPVILTSRADSRQSRIASCAIALMLAHRYRTAPP